MERNNAMSMQDQPNAAPTGLSIRQWLILLGVGTATLVLFISTLGFVVMESLDSRRTAGREVSMLSEMVVAHAGGAVAFGDYGVAQETLQSLSAVSSVSRACIYDLDGEVFVRYQPKDIERELPCPHVAPEGVSLENGRIGLTSPILVGDELVGLFFLESTIESLGARIARKASLGLPLLIGAGGIALLFAMSVQRRITDPIGKLVDSARALAGGDLGVTPNATGVREVAILSQAFSDMARELRGLIEQTRASTTAVAETVESLRESSGRLGRDARAQETAVADSAHSLEQIGSAIEAVTTHAEALSEVAEDTNRSLALLDESISQINGHTSELAASVDGTASSVTQMRASIESTAQNVEPLRESAQTTVLSVQALSRSVETIEEFAGRCDELASGTAREASRGQKVVEDAIEGSRKIRDEFGEIERVVSELSVQSDAIGAFIQMISEVADETGLLALNASIIAAQAGEKGRGFGVVAGHVRTLAARTAKSVVEISNMVEKVQQSTHDTVTLVAAGSERVKHGSDHWEEAGRGLREIATIADQSAATASQIAEASQSQASEISRVNENATHVADVSHQIATATEQQRRASENIEETANQMRDLAENLQGVTAVQRAESQRMEGMSERISDIAEAALAQREHREQIERALRVFRDGSRVSAQHAEELEKVVVDLSERSIAVEQAMARFKD